MAVKVKQVLPSLGLEVLDVLGLQNTVRSSALNNNIIYGTTLTQQHS